jgi:hypothetical protein
VRALDESTWPAFAELVERNNGVFGGCWCIGLHEKPETAAANRKRKRARVKAGTTHAALVFDGNDCVGWCQFGARGALELIAALGGGRVEGYPEDAASVPAGFLFNGALTTYEKPGFVRDRKIGKHRWVVTKTIKPLARHS